MAQKISALIGYVNDVQGQGMTAVLNSDQDRYAPIVVVGGERILVGQLGSYVALRQKHIEVLALVTRVQEHDEGSRTAAGATGSITVRRAGAESKRIISLLPLGQIDENGDFHRGVKHFPTTGAEVHAVGSDQIKKIFEKYRSKQFSVGFLPTHPSLDVCLDPSTLFGRHFTILGQSGSGKSWVVASLLQRAVAIMPKAHIILLDLHGEYCWKDNTGKVNSAFDDKIVRYVDARDLEIPYWLMTYAELVDLLIDRNDPGASTQIALLRESIHELRKKANKKGFREGEISIDSPVYFSLEELYLHFKAANEQTTNFGKTKGPLYGQFDEFLIKLQSRFNDVRYDFLLKPKRRTSSETLPDLLRDFVGLGEPKRQITVIDMSPVPFDVRPTVSAQIGRLAFEFNFWNPEYREFPILLVCEEAHAYIPRASGTQYEGTRVSMERIAKEGRKYGVGLAVVSQRPHELSETVLAQCGTFLCMRITNPDDQEYIRELVPEGERDLIDILAALGRGEVMALGEAVPLPTRFQFYRPEPAPNSGDVDFFAHWKTGPDDLDVERIVDRWRRQIR